MSVRRRAKDCLVAVLLGLCALHAAGCAEVSGTGATKTSAPSNPPGMPASPVNVTATAGNAQVTLSWNASANARAYHVKRGPASGGPFSQIAAPSMTGYVDTPLMNGTTYFYVVSSVGATGESSNSASVSAKPTAPSQPPPPSATVTGVTISPTRASANTSGTLTFTASVQGTTSNKAVTWTAARGAITSSGRYTAPASAVTDTVIATSSADPTKSASATVTVVTPPPSPTPPPPPQAPSPSGLSSNFFGLSISGIQASHFPTVPFGAVRLWDTNTTWAQIETSSGVYSWNELDTWLRSVSGHGKESMYTFGRVPHWISMRPSEACPYFVADPGCAAPPSDVDTGDATWKAFVTALVRHSLSDPQLHIAYYELWNEPDLQRNWTGTPAQLATLAKDAYAIIHGLDPNAKVVGPGASTANQFGVHYLPGYYAAGGATAQDIVGLHAYLYTGSSFSTTPAGITTSISQLQNLMATYQISSKPIWFTEGNWNGDGGGSLTDSQKAAYLAQEYMLMWSSEAVDRYFWYSWDSPRGTLWIPASGLTQAGTAFDQLAGWLIGSTHSANPCTTAADGTSTCTLTLSTGYPAEIIWNAGASKTITVGTEYVTFRTLASSTMNSISNHQVAVGPLPVLVVQGQTAH
jgi:polysaccharide biosynthesis protein PslG